MKKDNHYQVQLIKNVPRGTLPPQRNEIRILRRELKKDKVMGAIFSQYLSMAIFELKENVIGIFKQGDSYHMITKYDEESGRIDTVRFGQLGGVQYDYGMSTERGTFKLFPEGKTMNDMQDDITAWSDFYNNL